MSHIKNIIVLNIIVPQIKLRLQYFIFILFDLENWIINNRLLPELRHCMCGIGDINAQNHVNEGWLIVVSQKNFAYKALICYEALYTNKIIML